jgi:hypothetical protein
MTKKQFLINFLLIIGSLAANAQTDSVPQKKISKFDQFNAKAERLFKIIPVPIISYSSDAGNTFGLAKNNIIELSKKDTISKPSRLSEVVTFSTKGRVNASVATELIFNQNKNIIIGYINYRKQPEYLFGIGNDVKREDIEPVQYERFKFFATFQKLIKKNFYVGIPIDVGYFFNIKPDSGANSFLVKDNVLGYTPKNGGFTFGTGVAALYDNRENRYNPKQGTYAMAILVFHPDFLGDYNFTHFELDVRKYFNPWLKHIVAIQATTMSNTGSTPYYELSQLGGEKQMRGYYQGAYRDKILADAQVEYRMPVWNIFGIAAWLGTGRVASSYSNLSLDGWKLSYGMGIRIRVDTKHDTNLRIDFGYGPNGIRAGYFSFAEAF